MSASAKFLILMSALALAACADNAVSPDGPATGNGGVSVAPAPAPSPSEPAPETATPPPAPSPRPSDVAKEADTPEAGEETALAPAVPVRSFAELVGKTGLQVRSAMGAPDRVTDQPPARVWRYELSGCSLDLFLFPDVSSGAQKALTWNAQTREPEPSAGIDPLCNGVSADG